MDNRPTPRLVLASQSPIRSALLAQAGLDFKTRPASVDESSLIAKSTDLPPPEIAMHLAEAKAGYVASRHPEAIVVGADQLLVLEGAILQKPENHEAARQRLERLSGKSHLLVTGVVLAMGDRIVWRHAETAVLTMHELSPNEIARHMAEEEDAVLQSVGAYRLEGPGIRLFAALEGDFYAMLGLPLLPLLCALRLHAPECLPGLDGK
jgi:septum formation protein